MFWKGTCYGCYGLCRLQVYYAGLVETPVSCLKRKPGPLSDILQAVACIFPPFQKSLNTPSIPPVPTCGSIWVVLWLLFFKSAPCTFPQRTGHLLGAISGSPWSLRLHSKLPRTILALKLSVTSSVCSPLFELQSWSKVSHI